MANVLLIITKDKLEKTENDVRRPSRGLVRWALQIFGNRALDRKIPYPEISQGTSNYLQ